MHRFRKILASALLATYASISLLGQGLHLLTPDDGHHHDHAAVALSHPSHAHAHGSCGDHHEYPQAGQGGSADLVAGDHDCEICEFLAQAKSAAPQITAPLDLQAVVADLQAHTPAFHSPLIIGLPAARGPPQLLA